MREFEQLSQVMRAAGKIALTIQQRQFVIATKANKDIVTEADLAIDEILQTQLLKAFPHDGWLSEETKDDPSRLQCARVWIVDPIDGTKEFATGVPEYAISVALVENATPILAAVFNPATDEFFHAIKNQGTWLNGKKICCNEKINPTLSLLASRSEYARGEWKYFEESCHVKQVGSIAYKLALVAAGKAHATFSLGPKNEWDIAAGVLLVQESGGIVTDKANKPLRFNQANVKVNGIVAIAPVANQQLSALLTQHAKNQSLQMPIK